MEEVESASQFWSDFNQGIIEIRAALAGLQSTSTDGIESSDVKAALAAVKQSHSKLQAFATSSTAVLPLYDVRRAQEVSYSCVKFQSVIHYSDVVRINAGTGELVEGGMNLKTILLV
jgi:hypothetical protein